LIFTIKKSDFNKLCYYYYDLEGNKDYSCQDLNEFKVNNSDNFILDNLMLKNDNYSLLITTNHYLGKYQEGLFIKGVKNGKFSVKKEGDDIEVHFEFKDSPIHNLLLSLAFLKNHTDNYEEDNLNFDIKNSFKIKSYLTQPFALLKNNINLLEFASTFTNMMPGNLLFELYDDFKYNSKSLINENVNSYLLNNWHNLRNVFVMNDSLFIFPQVNSAGNSIIDNLITSNKNFGDVTMVISFEPLTQDSYLVVKKLNGVIKIGNLQPNEYLLIINFKNNEINYKLFDKNLNEINSNSTSFSNSPSQIQIGAGSYSNSIKYNGKLNGVKVFSVMVFNLTENNLYLNPNIQNTETGFKVIFPANYNNQVIIFKIPDELKNYYKVSSNAEGFCYLDEYFRCTYKFTNLIALKIKSGNNVTFNRVENKGFFITNIIQPKFELIPNDKQIQLSAENAILGLPYYNLIWKDKDSYFYFGTEYPITTRKGRTYWKILRGLHQYTNLVQYNIIDYPFNSYFISNLKYQMKNDEINIIKD